MVTATAIEIEPRRATVADLLHALGDIAPERVRTVPPPGTATEADLLRAGKPICELIDGTLVEKEMGSLESMLGMRLGRLIGNFVDAHKLGVLTGEAGFIKFKKGNIRAPDVTFIPWSSLPANGFPKEAFWKVAPGLIVEVLSPGNTDAEIERKLREFFGAKCQLAWVIDPATKTAKVYTSATAFTQLKETDTLDGGSVLPGFALALQDLFAVPERP